MVLPRALGRSELHMFVRVRVALVHVVLDSLRFYLVQLGPQRLQLALDCSRYLAVILQVIPCCVQREELDRVHILNQVDYLLLVHLFAGIGVGHILYCVPAEIRTSRKDHSLQVIRLSR